MTVKPVISIIVVSFNTRSLTLKALRTAISETLTPLEIIVIDNASNDGSPDAIAIEFPEVTLLRERENHGFARANNLAAKKAQGDFLLLLNPDTITIDGGIDKLLEFAKKTPDAQLWGGQTRYADGSLNQANCWQQQTLWNLFCRLTGLARYFSGSSLFNPEAYGGWDREGVRQVDIITGCFLLLPRSLWERLGGFDETFWMYGEEADLCLRARNLGGHPLVTSTAKVVHYGGASDTVRVEKMIKLLSAKVLLIKRHFPSWKIPLGLFLLRMWPATRSLAYSLAGQGRSSPWIEIWKRRHEWWDGY